MREPLSPWLSVTTLQGRGSVFSIVLVCLCLVLSGSHIGRASEPPAGPIFSERAEELGIRFQHFIGATGEYFFPEINGAGSGLIDFDNDGDLDIYIAQGSMLEDGADPSSSIFPPPPGQSVCDVLYRSDQSFAEDGSVEIRYVDVTGAAGIEACGYGIGVATGDYDNDGWTDLYITNVGPNLFFRNNGDGTFSDVTDETGTDDPRWSVPAVFFDYDHDGFLDLYVGNYADFRLANHKDCFAQAGYRDYCGPKSYSPEPDRMFHNLGDGRFEDVSIRIGTNREYGYALGAIPGDFNGDGWIDLYVANDGVENQLWINRKDGSFFNDALLAGCAVNAQGQPEASMGVDAGDFDGDGDLDLFMAHLVNETNTLYVNNGKGIFQDRSASTGVGAGSWRYTGFGAAFLDLDNDGWLDLLIATGGATIVEELMQAQDPFPFHQPNQLFYNLGDGTFREISERAGADFVRSEVGRGAAIGDLDSDGDTDVGIHNDAGPFHLFFNNVGSDQAWIGVSALDGESGRDRIGSSVVVRRQGTDLWRTIRVAGSYASSNDPRALIGLGSDPSFEEIEVRWDDGSVSRYRGLPANRYIRIREGRPE